MSISIDAAVLRRQIEDALESRLKYSTVTGREKSINDANDEIINLQEQHKRLTGEYHIPVRNQQVLSSVA